MNCRDLEPLVLAERDGVLTAPQHAALEQHLAACPACRSARARLEQAISVLQTDAARVRVPDIDDEWRTLRARMHDADAVREKKNSLAPVWWLGAPLAAAAAVAFAFFISQPTPSPGDFVALSDGASADFVEAGDAEASTMVYVDKESGWLVVWAADAEGEASG